MIWIAVRWKCCLGFRSESPPAPLFQRGETFPLLSFPPFSKGGEGGFEWCNCQLFPYTLSILDMGEYTS